MNVSIETGKFGSAAIAEFHSKNFGLNVINSSLNLKAGIEQIMLALNHMTVHQCTSHETMFHSDGLLIECEVGSTGGHVSLTVIGVKSKVESITAELSSKFESYGSYVRWVYDPQYLESINVPLPEKNPPFEEMYPWLKGESLSSYYNRFVQSDCSILLLIGAPGTGKTSFLRDMLRKTKQNAIVTYHPKVLEQESFFADWYQSSKENFVIAEDADEILSPRSDGNKILSRFLNLGDGLISLPNKKIIFTCNLERASDIDSALTRPGRCFDVVKFNSLNREQSKAVANKIGVEFNLDGSEFTVSEIFNAKKTSEVQKTKNSFGFLS
jgi:ATPase family associated with various cellular activities (AAA)